MGAIQASNLTARGNGANGVVLWNQEGTATGGVTLTGVNVFEDNAWDGLLVYSHGAIALSNVTARWNGSGGAYLTTQGVASPQKVTLTGFSLFGGNTDEAFEEGWGCGLWVEADGQITISNLTASENVGSGAILDDRTLAWSGTPGITLTGTNRFLNNGGDGLFFASVGLVTLSNVTADGNGQDGVDGLTDGAITITTASLTANAGYGWKLHSPAVVTLKGVHAFGNGTNNLLSGGGTLKIYRS